MINEVRPKRQRRPSIAWRLAIGLAAFTALLWLGSAAIATHVTRDELEEAFDESMRQSALRLLPLAIFSARGPDDDDDERRVSGLQPEEELYTYAVRDRNGRVVLAAADAPDASRTSTAPDGFSEIGDKRAFSLTDRHSGFSILVLEKTNHRAEALRSSIFAHLLPLAALIPLIFAGIWVAIRFAMRPVEALSRDIAKRDRRDLSPLVGVRQPVELEPIAVAVGGLLDRLRQALDAERAFAASSAHELRTPIAGALAQVQRLAIELGEGPSQARIAEIETSLKHLSQLSEKLLQLSRLDAGFAQSEGEVAFEPILKLVARDYGSASRSAGRVRLTIEGGGPLRARVNGDAFAIAVTNLVENALKHGAADGPVDIVAGFGPRVRVISRGPVVPPQVLARLGEPFVRGATTAKGTGLGLTITRSILEQTGGRMDISSPASGAADGFEVVLDWSGAGVVNRPGIAGGLNS